MNIELVKKSPYLKDFLWVAKALTKDRTRPILMNIRIEADKDNKGGCIIVATDGRRLHVAKINGLVPPVGNYRIIKQSPAYMFIVPDESGAIYPNFWQVIPDCKTDAMRKFSFNFCNDKDGGSLFKIATDIYALQKSIFNLYYLQEAVSFQNCYAFQQDNLSPLRMQNEPEKWTRLAVVMPCRVN